MSFEDPLRRKPVSVFLTNEDQMCLRRLMEHDTHEPGDLTASEAQSGVVETAMSWVMTTMSRLAGVNGTLVLHHSDGQEIEVDWLSMLRQSVTDEGVECNTELLFSDGLGTHMLTMLCETWGRTLEQPVTAGAMIRFSIRWRHESLRLWRKHQKNPSEPELGIRFLRTGKSTFGAMAI